MENGIKRCPFRKDENGEFAECYGDKCMAYLEYDAIPFYQKGQEKPAPVHYIKCEMVTRFAFS